MQLLSLLQFNEDSIAVLGVKEHHWLAMCPYLKVCVRGEEGMGQNGGDDGKKGVRMEEDGSPHYYIIHYLSEKQLLGGIIHHKVKEQLLSHAKDIPIKAHTAISQSLYSSTHLGFRIYGSDAILHTCNSTLDIVYLCVSMCVHVYVCVCVHMCV